jgi:Na+-translocating ferredoxin:NAD+ oxidoreductase subunit B
MVMSGGQDATLADRIDAVLPQTQCQRCGFESCRPYAEALANGDTSADLCPPGGETVRAQLRALTQATGVDEPIHTHEPMRLAYIVEEDCIGCTKCIRVCPVDAIVGAQGVMHTVVGPWCSGCDLCAPVCPTNCIDMRVRSDECERVSAPQLRIRFQEREARRVNAGKAEQWAGYVDLDGVAAETLRADVRAAIARRQG